VLVCFRQHRLFLFGGDYCIGVGSLPQTSANSLLLPVALILEAALRSMKSLDV
jgi:hypothetical protein